MKLPITRETTGWAMSSTTSQVSRPSSRSSTRTAIARISSSCWAIRFGVNPRWNSALRRSCFGGSIAMNIDVISSSGIAWVNAMQPPRSEENVFQSRLTVWTSVGRDRRPEAGLVRVLVDLRPVHRALAAKPLEQLVGRAVLPVLRLADVDLVEALVRLGWHLILRVARAAPRQATGWLASFPVTFAHAPIPGS